MAGVIRYVLTVRRRHEQRVVSERRLTAALRIYAADSGVTSVSIKRVREGVK